MASTSLRSKSLYHVRSVSLPSCHHPSTLQVEEHFSRLRSSESTSSSLSSIGNKLNVLENMFDSFDDILQLPNIQQAFAKNEKWVEEILDGYMKLLDLCANVKEVSSLAKQDVQELLSVLRRRRDTNEIGNFLTARKKAKKDIIKSLKDLKNIKIKHKKNENEAIGSMFIDMEEATVEVFESLMSYIAGSRSQSTLSGLVAKKYFGRSVSLKAEVSNKNEFENVDKELEYVISRNAEKVEKALKLQNLQSQLTNIECNIQDVEEGLECLFRRLIKTRVSLLNILNH